jgi:uncharacterized RDD family membrane protein YckC
MASSRLATAFKRRQPPVLLAVTLLACWLASPAAKAQPEPPVPPVADTNAPPAPRNIGDFIHVFGGGDLPAGQECNEAVFIFGTGRLEGNVRRSAVAAFGGLEINGTVGREVVVVFGSLKLGSNAVLKGPVRIIGGTLERHPDAELASEPYEIGKLEEYPLIAGVGEWLRQGLLLGRPLPPKVTWVRWVAAAFFLVYMMTLVLFPRPVEASMNTLEHRPIGSFFTGLLVKMLFAPVVVLLAATGVGVLVIPFLLLALLAAAVFGKTAVLRFTGQQIGRQLGTAVLQRPLIALAVGAAVFCLFYMIPVLGLITWGVTLLLGVGAATLAAFSGMRRETGGNGGVQAEGAPVRLQSAATGAPPALAAVDELALPRVGFWLRFLALALDVFLFLCLAIVLARPFGGAAAPLLLLAWGAYHVGMWTWKGTTIGGIVMGLKLVRIDGRPADLAVALVRAVSSLFSALALGLGFFWAGWSRTKRSWHDLIAGTVIVKTPRGMALV